METNEKIYDLRFTIFENRFWQFELSLARVKSSIINHQS